MVDSHQVLASQATLTRRFLSLIYELAVLSAVLLVAALPFVVLTRDAHGVARPLLQLYLMLIAGAYFVCQWCRGGQTLPMKTWRLRLVRRDGAPLTRKQALQRYCVALAGTLAFGAGFAWALIDPERQFLHDRVMGTRVIKDDGTIARNE